jgi:CelD/BcsL family acetyltransferase involved in cellulose biosynthesis
MVMTARLDASPGSAYAAAHSFKAGTKIARVDVFHDLASAEPYWRALEGEFATAFQRYDFLAAWHRHVGAREGLEPRIVVALDAAGQALCVVPLCVPAKGRARIGRFMGGKHPNFNMALWRNDVPVTMTRDELDAMLSPLGDHGVDALAFAQQPRHWRGVANPFALLARQPSVNDCPLMIFPPGAAGDTLISSSLRRRLKSKEKKYQDLSGYHYRRADTADQVHRALDAFFMYKPKRMAMMNLPDVFAERGMAAFVHDICDVSNEEPDVVIHMLVCDEEVIAIFAGTEDGRRFSMMFNTYTLSDNAKYSPGLILIRHIVEYYARRNYSALDLGIGGDHYKTMFCKDQEELFDSFIPLTAKGLPAVLGLSFINRAKYAVKRSPALTRIANTIRSKIKGESKAPSEDQD